MLASGIDEIDGHVFDSMESMIDFDEFRRTRINSMDRHRITCFWIVDIDDAVIDVIDFHWILHFDEIDERIHRNSMTEFVECPTSSKFVDEFRRRRTLAYIVFIEFRRRRTRMSIDFIEIRWTFSIVDHFRGGGYRFRPTMMSIANQIYRRRLEA